MSKKKDASEEALRSRLTSEQFEVTQKKGTERAFTGRYHDCKSSGMYECVCCGKPLFGSDTKFDSGSGWPSFWTPTDESAVDTTMDASHGMTRQEAVCSECGAHLGHVFPDGPEPTGLRYCINSASLELNEDDAD